MIPRYAQREREGGARWTAGLAAAMAYVTALHVAPARATSAAPTSIAAYEAATEINKNVADPVSTTWSLKVKNNLLFLDVAGHADPVQYQLQFQPTLPVLLTPDLKLITRPQFTLVDDKPYTNGQGELRRTTGVGDTILDLVLSPIAGPWLLALGPTFVFPTANLDQTGRGKWQAGPAGVFGYRAKRWLAGVIAQQWWSFAGAPDRSAVNELHLQYIADLFFADGWSFGTSPTLKVDWRAAAGQQVTFPLGPTIGKVVDFPGGLPIKFELEGLYVPVRPDPNGEQFVIQITITPVVPALLRGPLFGRR